jgi:S1-C subfamily serine protease
MRIPRALYCAVATGLLLCCCTSAHAEKIRITSTPPGATVEIDGVAVGVTPFERDYPGGYFHRTRTSLGARLAHPLIARISMDGYAAKEILLTDGPMNWVGLNGRSHGEYWLLKSEHFDVQLDSIAQVFSGRVTVAAAPTAPAISGLGLEDLVARVKPAVVYLKGLDRAGTGFFVTESGVIATNAHVARGEESLLVLLSDGRQLEGKVVYVDTHLDLALMKIPGDGYTPLALAGPSLVRQGENVVAIGNPGSGMLFSATKGIVSAVGPLPIAGPGTWIQTDAPVNPGNSGGPLVDEHGNVIGVSTIKLVSKNVNGIGFALSAGDLLAVLRRFYPQAGAAVSSAPNSATAASSPAAASAVNLATDTGGAQSEAPADSAPVAAPPDANGSSEFGTVAITSDPPDAEIYLDGKFVGNAPARLRIPAGEHMMVLRCTGRSDWQRKITNLAGSSVSLKVVLPAAK